MTPVSFTTKCNYKNAMRTYLMTKPWSFHLTLNLNTDWNINRFQILIKHLENDIKSKYFSLLKKY